MDFSGLKGFEWDEGNLGKVSARMDPAIAEMAFVGSPFVAEDALHSELEKRWFLVNKVFNRFVFAVFTIRHDRVRIISARFMKRKEVKKYEKFFEKA